MSKIILSGVLLCLSAVVAFGAYYYDGYGSAYSDNINDTNNYNANDGYYNNYNYGCYNGYYGSYYNRPGVIVYGEQMDNIANNVQAESPQVSMGQVRVANIKRDARNYNISWQATGAVPSDTAAVCTYSDSHGWLTSRMQYPAGTAVGVSGVTRYTPQSTAAYVPQTSTQVENVTVLY